MDVLQFSRMCFNHLDVGSNPFKCSWLFEIWCNMTFHVASSSQLFRLKLGGNKNTSHWVFRKSFTQNWIWNPKSGRFERCYFPYSNWDGIFRFQPLILEEKNPSYHPPLRSWRIFSWEKKPRQKITHPHLAGIRVSSIGGASEATLWWGAVATGHCPTLAEGAKMGSPNPRNNPGGDCCWVSGASQHKTRCVYNIKYMYN